MRIQKASRNTYDDLTVDLVLDQEELAAIKDGYVIAENIYIGGYRVNLGVLFESEDQETKESAESNA